MSVHDLHLWEVASASRRSRRTSSSAPATAATPSEEARGVLESRYDIGRTTLQIDRDPGRAAFSIKRQAKLGKGEPGRSTRAECSRFGAIGLSWLG